MPDMRIEVNQATKRFKSKLALDSVSIKCTKGDITGIIGRNGSGKTVLFKCICGFYQLNEGEIIINGVKRNKQGELLQDSGIIIEEPAFLTNWSSLKNLEFLYTIKHKNNKDYLKSIIKQVGLDPELKIPVSKYSMGMRQRLAIAQAIMEDSSILILDEPMNGLDENGVKDIRNLLQRLKSEGKTILLASHNKEDIDILCDSVYKMDGGKIVKVDEDNK